MYLSIIIPAYNEEQRIRPTLDSVAAFARRVAFPVQVLVVDDGSSDGTAALIKARSADDDIFGLITYQPNRGKGYAVRTGMLAATGEYRLFMDADGSMAVEQVLYSLEALHQSNAQVAIATRYHQASQNLGEEALLRAAISRLGRLLIQRAVLPGISDSQCGFKVFTAEAAAALFSHLATYRWGFDVEVLARARALGMRVVEVPVTWQHIPGTRLAPSRALPSVLVTTTQVAWRYHTGQYGYDLEQERNDADSH